MRKLVVLMLLLALAGCGAPERTAAPPPAGSLAATSTLLEPAGRNRPQVGDLAPDFVYTMPDGATRKLSDLRGQRVLINFWATWCAPCKIEMPEIQHAFERYGADGFMVLAISNEAPDVVDAFARDNPYTFPLISNNESDIVAGYGVTGFPVSFFINSDGVITAKQIGLIRLDLLTQRIEAME